MFTSLVIYRQDGENGVEDYRDISIAPAVIPAKAGIQWFLRYIPPACCRQGLGGNDNQTHHSGKPGASRHKPEFIQHPAPALLDSGLRRNDGRVLLLGMRQE